MGWNGLLGNNGRVNPSDEEVKRNRAAKARKTAEAEELFSQPRPATDWDRMLQTAVEEAQVDSDWHEPKPDPTDEEIAALLAWFGSRDEGMSYLTSFLAERGWNTLEDLWTMREALLIVQYQYLSGN